MMKHVVLLDLPEDYDEEELFNIMLGIGDLIQVIPGFTKFEHGPNRDFEAMSKPHGYGFICHFDDEDTAHQYIAHSGHIAMGKRLVEMCNGGIDGITVIDLDVATLDT
jgi:hypothetical protein